MREKGRDGKRGEETESKTESNQEKEEEVERNNAE